MFNFSHPNSLFTHANIHSYIRIQTIIFLHKIKLLKFENKNKQPVVSQGSLNNLKVLPSFLETNTESS